MKKQDVSFWHYVVLLEGEKAQCPKSFALALRLAFYYTYGVYPEQAMTCVKTVSK